jgi:hypothetical protein
MCSDAHFDALITFAIARKVQITDPRTNHTAITEETATAFGEILKRENARSLFSRYEDVDDREPYAFKKYPHVMTDGQAAVALSCADYQSCESDDWSTTLAHAVLEAIRATVTEPAQRDRSAPWGINDHDAFTPAALALRANRGF